MTENNGSTYNSSGRQKMRVFLEGREVPAISATTIFKIGMPAMATIELVPLQVIKFIKPRTQVHIFVRDSMAFGTNDYYLCFEGEVMGRSMVKRHDGRAFRITAFDYSNYWDDAKAFIMNPNFLAGKVAPAVLYGEPTPHQKTKADPGTVLNTAANSNSLMVDFLVRHKDAHGNPDIIQGITDIARRLASVNEFYRSAYERLRILDRIYARSSGRMGDFLKSIKVEEFLASYTGAQGGMMTLRQMLMGILTLLFHDSITVPFPSFIKTTRTTSSGTSKGFAIAQFLFIPDMYLIPPPKCNVFFPSQQIGFEFDEDFRSSPTRYGFRCSFPILASNDATEATYPIQYYPRPFADFMVGAKGTKRQATTSDLNSILGPSKITYSADGNNYADIFYGGKSKGKSVGISFTPVLREADYLSNEEAIKGIYYETDVLMPAYSALVRPGATKIDFAGRKLDIAAGTPESRNNFMKEIGAYLFFKKRYSSRQVKATTIYSPFVVPGFNCLFLDDSTAGQSFIAKLQGVTHNMTHEGFSTLTDLAYGRDFDEIDFMSGGAGDPPLPKWFDATTFGISDTTKANFDLETKFLGPPDNATPGRSDARGIINQAEFDYRNNNVTSPTVYLNLSPFYQDLLGCDAITGLGPAVTDSTKAREVLVTTRGTVSFLINEYIKKENQQARDAYVRSYIQRPVVNLEEAFAFLGAAVVSSPGDQSKSTVPEEFAKFTAILDSKITGLPGRFDGINPSGPKYSDFKILQIRRDVIDAYVQQLRERRGFRG